VAGAAVRIEAEAMRPEGHFRDEEDREWFLERLGKLADRHGFSVEACSLLAWRLDLVIVVGKVSASVVMHDLLGPYAKHYNRKYGFRGHVFLRRHHQYIVENKAAAVLDVRLKPAEAGVGRPPENWVYPDWPSAATEAWKDFKRAIVAGKMPGSPLWVWANGGPPGRGSG
jgi:hypothetical protein